MENDCKKNPAHVVEQEMGSDCRNRRGGGRRWIAAGACERPISGDERASVSVMVCTSATATSMMTPSGSRMEIDCTTNTAVVRADLAFATATGCKTETVSTTDRAVENENARGTVPGQKIRLISYRKSTTSSCCRS